MPLSRLSIKHKLFIILSIIALPAVCLLINSGLQQRRESISHAKEETQKLAEAIYSEQKIIVASAQQLFIALSQLPEVKSRKLSYTQAILSEILKQSPQYSNIFIADISGAVWVSAVPLYSAVTVADRRYFKNVLSSGKMSSGEYHIARTSNKATLNLAYPLKDDAGKVTAVICAGISLDYYRHIFNTYNLPKSASYSLLDYQGIILTRAIEPTKYIGKQSDPQIVKHMLEGPDEETSIGKSSILGDIRVQTYRKLRLEGESIPYMYIRVGIPASVVMSESNAALSKNLMIYTISLLIAFLFSWLIAKKYIINKIAVLQRSSQRLADGYLDTRVTHEVGGGELGMLGQAFDNMAQKLAIREQALRESETNYRDIFNTTNDAIFVNDTSGRIVEANNSAVNMFGYTREELVQLSLEVLISGEPPYSFAEALILIENSLKEGTQEFEWLSKRKNGELFWTEIAIIATSIVGEKRILTVVRDITERREIEHVKEAMLSTVSHEMRSPLTAILGFLEFIIENPVEDAQMKDYLTIMLKEGDRLNKLITNFLDMQRIKANLHKYNFQPVAVRPLLEEAAAIFAIPSTNHLIKYDLSPDLPRIIGDEVLLHQVLTNLLSNATKYSPEGSNILLGARWDANSVTLSVKDEGIGLPPASMDKIFDMFYRIDTTSERHITGTGLGLALVKEIVVAHKGKVWVESVLGKGSTFYVSLPVVSI